MITRGRHIIDGAPRVDGHAIPGPRVAGWVPFLGGRSVTKRRAQQTTRPSARCTCDALSHRCPPSKARPPHPPTTPRRRRRLPPRLRARRSAPVSLARTRTRPRRSRPATPRAGKPAPVVARVTVSGRRRCRRRHRASCHRRSARASACASPPRWLRLQRVGRRSPAGRFPPGLSWTSVDAVG